MLTDCARPDFSRPAHDQRHADATFREIALLPSKRAAAVEELRIMSSFGVRTVVAREEHNRVILNAQLVELLNDLPDIPIQSRHHGRKVPFLWRPCLA